MNSGALDLLGLDRDVARAAAKVEPARAALGDDPGANPANPLEAHRHVAGKSAYDALRAASPSLVEEPLRDALVPWVHALIETRIGFELEVQIAKESRTRRGHVLVEPPEETSYDEALRGSALARESGVREAWLEAAAELAPPLAPLEREAAERRTEVARRLGLSESAREAPEAMSSANLERGARELLRVTRDLRASLLRSVAGHRAATTPRTRLSVWIGEALAIDAGEGWPARLTTHWLQDRLREMSKGVHIATALPRIVGASSFARGLYRFGLDFRMRSKSALPFSIAKSPVFTDAHRFGFVFGGLPLTRVFHAKVLGVGERVGARQARSLAKTALWEATVVAMRWLLTRDARPPSREEWEEQTLDVFGGPIDARFRGAWPRRRGDETGRLEGLLTTLPLTAWLESRFDEDWFRNPRAGDFLRARALGPARVGVPGMERMVDREEGAIESETPKLAAALGRMFEEAIG
jgi:hypothetical protein